MNEVNPFMNDFVKKMLDYNRAFVEHGLYEKYTTSIRTVKSPFLPVWIPA